MNTTNTHNQQEEYIGQLASKITTALSLKSIAPKKVSFMSRLASYKQRNQERIVCEVNGMQKSGTIKIYEDSNQSYWAESEETVVGLAQIELFEHFATFIQTFESTMKNPIKHLVILSSVVDNINWLYKKSGVWIFTLQSVQEIVNELDRQKAVKSYFDGN